MWTEKTTAHGIEASFLRIFLRALRASVVKLLLLQG
jgi:hypothetical protein